MITSLINDNNLITNSLDKSGVVLGEKLHRVVEKLNEILKIDGSDIFLADATKFSESMNKFKSTVKDLEKPLDRMKVIRDFRINIIYFIQKHPEYLKYIVNENEKELLNDIFLKFRDIKNQLLELEIFYISLAYLEAFQALINTIDIDIENLLIILQNLYSSMFYVLEILEEDYASFIPENILKIIKNYSNVLSLNETFKQYVKTSKTNDIQQKIRNYMNSIRHTSKAILWELEKIKQFQPNVELLLNFIQSSPSWEGEDFEECLDFINEQRKK